MEAAKMHTREAAEMFGYVKQRIKSGIASASNASKASIFWVPTLLDCDDAIRRSKQSKL